MMSKETKITSIEIRAHDYLVTYGGKHTVPVTNLDGDMIVFLLSFGLGMNDKEIVEFVKNHTNLGKKH